MTSQYYSLPGSGGYPTFRGVTGPGSADQRCQERANAAKLGGTWTAWLSYPTQEITTRIGNYKYYRLDDVLVADGIADLTDGSIRASIHIDENGDEVSIPPVSKIVWTGTQANGSPALNNCNAWTSPGFFGLTGVTLGTGSNWTDLNSTGCASSAHLYCFEQTIPSFELTVSKTGGGTGTVTSAPEGINCGTSCPTQDASFKEGTLITLTADPDEGFGFAEWSSNCAPLITNPLQCTLTLTSDTTVTARFQLPPTVSISDPDPNNWRNDDFPVGYAVQAYNPTCTLFTRNGEVDMAPWENRDEISCGAGGTSVDILVGPLASDWCSTEGQNRCGVRIEVTSIPFEPVEAIQNFSIDLTAPVITNFTASDITQTVDNGSQPLITGESSITLKWTAADGESGIKQFEVWRRPDGVGGWTNVSGAIAAGTTDYTDSPGGGEWWYGLHVLDNGNLSPNENCITEAKGHCGGVSTDNLDSSRTLKGPIRVVVDNTPPAVSFELPTPAPGAVISENFNIRYDATDNFSAAADMLCELFISTNGGKDWSKEKDIGCGLDQTETIEHAWCPTPGSTPDQCGVRIQATDQVGNSNTVERLYTFNQPPSVETMLDTSTFIAQPFTLTSTATDDNQLNPLTFSWSQTSWPGVANFASPSNQNTDVTFTYIGTYVLRLTVNDGFFEEFDEVAITVNHEPPVADAGPDQTIPLECPPAGCSVSTTVDGSASTDDGFLNPLTFSWSGPAEVTFDNPAATLTTATFSASGEYNVVLEVSDGEFTDTDVVRITVRNDIPRVTTTPNQIDASFGFPIAFSAGVTDDGLPDPPDSLELQWIKISGPGRADFADPTNTHTNVQLSQAGEYELALEAFDGEKIGRGSVIVRYGAPERYGLVPCGLIIDDPETIGLDETDPCRITHVFVLLQRLVDFALWKIVPLTIASLVVATGAIFFFQLGGPEVMARVRRIWVAVGKGVLILLFSWLFLNFLLGVLGFDINIFGRWYEISA